MLDTAAVTIAWLNRLSVPQAIWLAPFAFAAHIAEEAPRFPAWAQRYANPRFRRADYLRLHLSGLMIGIGVAALLSWTRPPWLVFACFTLILLPGYCFNIFFHVGATLWNGVYCPGLITAMLLYPPLVAILVAAARRDGLLTWPALALSFVLAGVIHAIEVGHNTYGVDLIRRACQRPLSTSA